MSLSVLPMAEVRVAVYDSKGNVVEERLFPTHSFTFNFANVFLAEFFSSPGLVSSPSPVFVISDVMANVYTIGYGYSNSIGQLTLPMCLVGCPNLSPYANGVINAPGIWAGYSQCPATDAALFPCSPIPSNMLSPGPLQVPYTVTGTSHGWQYVISQNLYNVSGNTITIGSLALVAALYATLISTGILYSVLVDNVNPVLSLPPGYYISVTYTITLPT
jgi:hypothetical protein